MAKWIFSDKEVKLQIRQAAEISVQTEQMEPRGSKVSYDPVSNHIMIELNNGVIFGFLPALIGGLEDKTPELLADVEMTPCGEAIRWEKLDIDTDILGLILKGVHAKQWAAKYLGRMGGQTKSLRKATTARENGKKGGRPKKEKQSA